MNERERVEIEDSFPPEQDSDLICFTSGYYSIPNKKHSRVRGEMKLSLKVVDERSVEYVLITKNWLEEVNNTFGIFTIPK